MKTLKRTAFALAAVTALTSLFSLAACGEAQKNRITLSVWTYYNNQQDSAFRRIINEFNDTVGKEKAIYVTSSSYSNPTKIAEEVEKNAKKELPEIFQLYSDDLKKIDDAYQNIASLDGYFTQAEKDLYVDNFFSEGYINGGLKLVPTAKSTELFMMNKTDWDVFAEDYNKSASEEAKVSLEDLSTVEGIATTAEKYYLWSGGDDGGKAFFGRDAYANFFLTSARSLGHTIFEKDGEKIGLNTDRETFKKIYDNFYVPYVKGYFYAKDRFRSDDVKTGDLLAYVGSTSSAGYFPSSVQESDTVSHAIETYVTPVPVFAGGQKVAIQQGAGFAVKKSDKATEAAAVEFLKYLSTGGLDLSVSLSYMPVTKADYKAGNAEKMQTAVIEDAWTQYLKKEEKTEADFTAEKAQEIKDGYRVSKKGNLDTYEVAYKTIKEYELWASIPFAQSSDARKLLEYALAGTISAKDELELAEMVKNLKNATALAALVEARVESGERRSEAAADELSKYGFDDWYAELTSILSNLLKG